MLDIIQVHNNTSVKKENLNSYGKLLMEKIKQQDYLDCSEKVFSNKNFIEVLKINIGTKSKRM